MFSGKAAVDSWYSEIKYYNFQSPGYQPNTGKMTNSQNDDQEADIQIHMEVVV